MRQDCRGRKDLKGFKVYKASKDPRVYKVFRARPDCRDRKGLKGFKANRDYRESRDRQVLMEPMERMVLRASWKRLPRVRV